MAYLAKNSALEKSSLRPSTGRISPEMEEEDDEEIGYEDERFEELLALAEEAEDMEDLVEKFLVWHDAQ